MSKKAVDSTMFNYFVQKVRTMISSVANGAAKLVTPRKITALLTPETESDTKTSAFDGTEDIHIPVEGVLPISKGGTGVASESAFVNLIKGFDLGGGKTTTKYGSYIGDGKEYLHILVEEGFRVDLLVIVNKSMAGTPVIVTPWSPGYYTGYSVTIDDSDRAAYIDISRSYNFEYEGVKYNKIRIYSGRTDSDGKEASLHLYNKTDAEYVYFIAGRFSDKISDVTVKELTAATESM